MVKVVVAAVVKVVGAKIMPQVTSPSTVSEYHVVVSVNSLVICNACTCTFKHLLRRGGVSTKVAQTSTNVQMGTVVACKICGSIVNCAAQAKSGF